MNFQTHPILFCVWSLVIGGQCYVALLALQKIRNLYPWFTALVCFMALKSPVLMWVSINLGNDSYFYAYYRSEFIFNVLFCCAVVEVFHVLFRPLSVVPQRELSILGICTLLMIAAFSLLNSALIVGAQTWEGAIYRTFDRATSHTSAILLAAVLLFSSHYEMPFRSRLKGITSGLFIMSSTAVVLTSAISNLQGMAIYHLAYLPLLAHIVSLTIWTYHIRRTEALVVVFRDSDLPELRRISERFRIALSYTPISCGLTRSKFGAQSVGKEKAKTAVNL